MSPVNFDQEKPKAEFLVWEVAEIASICSRDEIMYLNQLMERIAAKREANKEPVNPGYIVVPVSKPYAPEINAIIKHNEGGNV